MPDKRGRRSRFAKAIVLFDWDGTLVDTQPFFRKILNETFIHMEGEGAELLPDNQPIHNIITEMLCKRYGDEKGQKALNKLKELYFTTKDESGKETNIPAHLRHITLMPGAEDMLRRMKELADRGDVVLGVASNQDHVILSEQMKHLKVKMGSDATSVHDLFNKSLVFGSGGRVSHKPSPDMIIEIVKKAGEIGLIDENNIPQIFLVDDGASGFRAMLDSRLPATPVIFQTHGLGGIIEDVESNIKTIEGQISELRAAGNEHSDMETIEHLGRILKSESRVLKVLKNHIDGRPYGTSNTALYAASDKDCHPLGFAPSLDAFTKLIELHLKYSELRDILQEIALTAGSGIKLTAGTATHLLEQILNLPRISQIFERPDWSAGMAIEQTKSYQPSSFAVFYGTNPETGEVEALVNIRKDRKFGLVGGYTAAPEQTIAGMIREFMEEVIDEYGKPIIDYLDPKNFTVVVAGKAFPEPRKFIQTTAFAYRLTSEQLMKLKKHEKRVEEDYYTSLSGTPIEKEIFEHTKGESYGIRVIPIEDLVDAPLEYFSIENQYYVLKAVAEGIRRNYIEGKEDPDVYTPGPVGELPEELGRFVTYGSGNPRTAGANSNSIISR